MYAEVEPPARLEQILHLLVGFGLAEFLAEMKQYLFRHSEAGPSGYLLFSSCVTQIASYPLRDQSI